MSYIENVLTPIGNIRITATDSLITSITFTNDASHFDNELTKMARMQLEEFFLGQRHTFELPLASTGTAFQQRIWQQVKTIPIGTTTTYSAIAAQAGNIQAVRAAANAIGRNSFAIAIPCHRVIGKNNQITGYAWEPWRKEWLLKFEQTRSEHH
ncbi:methylated-DNA--[protein]-cysteine S-methyltransferase [Terribacillus sp. 179-K 1B1 HS]|uniref:methylated-DNA--[protein]-cysteine S-methyltransferase n=1 Tax=Terribacillus sp. 179-K 1B1 HS TaxID=3142388 RepID=UPI0039A2CBA8